MPSRFTYIGLRVLNYVESVLNRWQAGPIVILGATGKGLWR